MTRENRDTWTNRIEFFLAIIGAAVGYGNVWRFPYMCYQYGGAAFLIPYLFALIFAGVPVFALEIAVGQFSSFGCNKVFQHMAPIFHGIGWGSVTVSLIVAVYFNMLIAWSIYYLYISFQTVLPYSTCTNDWNTPSCYTNLEDQRCRERLNDMGAMFYNQSCHTSLEVQQENINETIDMLRYKNKYLGETDNTTICRVTLADVNAMFFNGSCWSSASVVDNGINDTIEFVKNNSLTVPADEYFFKGVLMQSEGFEEMGQVRWHLVIVLFLAWVLVFLCIFNGIKSSGKIWRAAAVQIFYTYGVAFGVIITFSSYNKFHSNVLRDAYLICCCDSLTSFYSGFAVFSTAGFIAKQLGKPVDQIIQQGSGLAFVVFPEALSRMPWSSFFSVIFFFMMILIGIDSQFTMIECPATALMDEFPSLRKVKPLVFLFLCVFLFLLGLPICMDGGLYVFTLINDWTAGWCIMLLCLCEVIAIIFVYGVKRFILDIEMMAGKQNRFFLSYWVFCWCFATPVYLIGIFITSLIGTIKYSSKVGNYTFPPWATTIGWLLSLASIIMVPIFAVYQIIRHIKRRIPFPMLFKPTELYCPAEQRDNRQSQPFTTVVSSVHPAYSNPVYASAKF